MIRPGDSCSSAQSKIYLFSSFATKGPLLIIVATVLDLLAEPLALTKVTIPVPSIAGNLLINAKLKGFKIYRKLRRD